uniref:AIG1-type G domain-containing protein n=1 Tax=Salarias fasciatus TaxID=181472 RepID=A0A672IJD2_SALFA
MTVGEKNLNRPNKTVLLVGETGTGKSALVNALFNHMMGVTWEDGVWFQLVEDNNSDQTQTLDVMVYQIFGYQGNAPPFSLTIIDTPGFGDTRGIERDVMISERLLDLFRMRGGVHSIHAVGLVVKSFENRLSDRLLYVFNSVMSLFGKDMERNIVALMTHSDGLTPQDALKVLEAAKIKCVRNQKNQPIHFLFDNRQKTERTEEEEFSLKYAWETSEEGLNQFTAFLNEVTPQRLDQTVNVLNERVRLTACIKNLQERKMEEEKWKLLGEAYQHVISLEKIALNVDLVSTYVHYDFLIKEMKERGDQEKVQKLEEMKRRLDERSKSVAAYVWNQVRGFWWKK